MQRNVQSPELRYSANKSCAVNRNAAGAKDRTIIPVDPGPVAANLDCSSLSTTKFSAKTSKIVVLRRSCEVLRLKVQVSNVFMSESLEDPEILTQRSALDQIFVLRASS